LSAIRAARSQRERFRCISVQYSDKDAI